jgi:hypothetical protein
VRHTLYFYFVGCKLYMFIFFSDTSQLIKDYFTLLCWAYPSSLSLSSCLDLPRGSRFVCAVTLASPPEPQLLPCHSCLRLQISPQRTTRSTRGEGCQQGSSGQRTHCAAPGRPDVAALPASPCEWRRWPSAVDSAIPTELQSGSFSWWRDPNKIRRLTGGGAIARTKSVEALVSEAPATARAPTL